MVHKPLRVCLGIAGGSCWRKQLKIIFKWPESCKTANFCKILEISPEVLQDLGDLLKAYDFKWKHQNPVWCRNLMKFGYSIFLFKVHFTFSSCRDHLMSHTCCERTGYSLVNTWLIWWFSKIFNNNVVRWKKERNVGNWWQTTLFKMFNLDHLTFSNID